MVVESNLDPLAVGDNGRAFGILQIHEGVVIDVNARYGTDYTHREMFDSALAQDVFLKYIEMYCTEERLHRKPTFEDYAHCWVAGPNFMHKKGMVRTRMEKYWEKVEREL